VGIPLNWQEEAGLQTLHSSRLFPMTCFECRHYTSLIRYNHTGINNGLINKNKQESSGPGERGREYQEKTNSEAQVMFITIKP
jgi:hypothetical protein